MWFEHRYITWVMFQYEWNIGVRRAWYWPGKSWTQSGWGFHAGPFWFRKWR